eukprot:jgi/Mesvir1/1089/Mv17601-RA.1
MLSHDPGNARLFRYNLGPSPVSHVPFTAFYAILQFLRLLSVYSAYTYLVSHDSSVVQFVFFLLLGASALFSLIYHPWAGVAPPGARTTAAAANGLLLALSHALWAYGLRTCGPVRTILAEYTGLALTTITSILFGRRSGQQRAAKLQGLLAMGAAMYLLALGGLPEFLETLPARLGFAEVHFQGALTGGALEDGSLPIDPPADGDWTGGAVDRITEGTEGVLQGPARAHPHALGVDLHHMAAPVASALLTSLSKLVERRVAPGAAARKRLHCLSTFYSALILLPFALLVSGTRHVAHLPASILEHYSGSTLGTFAVIIVFGVVLHWSVDALGEERLGVTPAHPLHLAITVVSVCFLELSYEHHFSTAIPFLVLCSLCLEAGILRTRGMVIWRPGGATGGGGILGGGGGGGMRKNRVAPTGGRSTLQAFWAHMTERGKTRSISIFLVINAMFMLVELGYGLYSNSLSLISDAVHMLFDCAALGIGLYASFIARMPSNYTYTYGFGRMEVLSGFINAVFLVFVGVLIILESFERFYDPPDIFGENLLLVSVLGLAVNLVGLAFFHDHSHGGGGHGHTHGDGGCPLSGKSSKKATVAELQGLAECGHGHSHGVGGGCDHGGDHGGSKGGGRGKGGAASHGHSHGDGKACHGHGASDKHDHGHGHGHGRGRSGHGHEDHDCPGHDHGHGHGQHRDHGHSHGHAEHDAEEDPGCGHGHAHGHGCEEPLSPGARHVLGLEQFAPVTASAAVAHAHAHLHDDHNMQGIFLHVLADTLGSVGVIASSLLIKYKGWTLTDPLCSLFVSALIVSSVIPLLKSSAEVLLQRVPRGETGARIRSALAKLPTIPGVRDVRRAHFWSHTPSATVGSLQLLVEAHVDQQQMLALVTSMFHDAGIEHMVVQIEGTEAYPLMPGGAREPQGY